jgi:L-threonylcarbamoyladenylate synthase
MTQTAIIDFHDPGAIQKANQIIKRGGTIAFPTDTVYGLSADVFENDAIRKIYAIKERSMLKALPVLIANMGQLERIISEMKESAMILAEAYWPGPLTLILPKAHGLPELLSPYSTIGVRMPDYPLTLELLETTGPLATTSANLSGKSNPRTAQDVLDQLGGRIDLLLDGGETPGAKPSTVVEVTTTEIKVLREGPILKSDIKALINKDLL